MVAAAAISAIAVTKWNLFAPKDYEECAERAARDAKSKDALSIFVSVCRSNFKGRRKTGGGYTYYDPCQDSTFGINGPNPTADEVKYISDQCLAYLSVKSQMEAEETELKRRAQQAAQEASRQQAEQEASRQQAMQEALLARQSAAMKAIRVKPAGFKCSSDYPTASSDCDSYVDLKVEVTNGSTEALSSITIGLAFVRTKSACPSSYAERHELELKLSPGEMRAAMIKALDFAFSKLLVCIGVVKVQFAGR